MRKIFLGFVFLVTIILPSKAKDEAFYCYNSDNNFIYKETSEEKNYPIYKNILNRCEIDHQTISLEVPKSVSDKFGTIVSERRNLFTSKYEVGEFTSKGIFRSTNDAKKMKDFQDQTEKLLRDVIANSKNEIDEYNRIRAQIAKQETESKKRLVAELKFSELEKIYSGKCNFGYKKGSDKFNNCLLEQEKKALAEQKKKQDLAEASKKKSETETKQMTEKLSKMNPDDRRAYNCTEKFGFRKGSDKFKDCIFELYKVESELEKLELQKKVAQANLEAAKAKETASRSEQDRAMALLQRQTSAQELSAAAALQQARIADFESNQRLFDRSMELLSGDRNLAGQVRQPQQRLKTNCTFNGRFMNCN